MVSGNPFAADSEAWKSAQTQPPTPSASIQAPVASQPADPFALPTASAYAPLQPNQLFPAANAAPEAKEYSFAELNPTAFGRPPPKQDAVGITRGESTASSVGQPTPGYASHRSGGFPGPSSHTSTPRDAVGGFGSLSQPTAQGFAGLGSQTSTPRNPSSHAPFPPHNFSGFGSQNSTPRHLPSERGWAPSAGQQPGVLNAGHQEYAGAPSTQWAQGGFGSQPGFPAQPGDASSAQSRPVSNTAPHYQHPGYGEQQVAALPNTGRGFLGPAAAPEGFPVGFGAGSGATLTPAAVDRSQPIPAFGFGLPDTASSGRRSGKSQAIELAGASFGNPAQQAAKQDEELWDFASLSSLRPKLKSRPVEEPQVNKSGLKPMRPTNDGTWLQPWALNSGSKASSEVELQTGNAGDALVPQRPASAAGSFGVAQSALEQPGQPAQPQATAATAQPTQDGLGGFGATAWPKSPAPTDAELPSKPSAQASQQPTSRVPWALPPPTKDLPRPGRPGAAGAPAAPQQSPTQSRTESNGPWQAFEDLSPQTPVAAAAQQLQGLTLGRRQPVRESIGGDEELARQLQEQWDRENGVSGRQGFGAKLGLRRPSSVAGIPPSSSQAGGAQGSGASAAATSWLHFSQSSQQPAWGQSVQTGGDEASSRAQAFLERTGLGSSADEEYARKLQQEYDAEHAKGVQHRAADSTASRAGWWQDEPQLGQQAAPQPISTSEDEELAHRLQQEEIERQRRAQAWPGPPGFQNPAPQQPGYGYPPPQTSYGTQPWWSQASQQSPPQPHQPYQPQPPYQTQNIQPSAGTADDEALARQLQEQFNAESGGPPSAPQPSGTPPSATLPSRPSAPSWKTRFDRLLAPDPDSLCVGCKKPVASVFGGTWRTALGGRWHPECLRCGGCNTPISDSTLTEKDGRPYHMECFKNAFHPRCCVCHQFCPEENNQVHWTTDTFWRYKACPSHVRDGTIRCYACNRYQPQGEDWVQVSTEGSRHLCLDCVSSIVVDTRDAQPLYREVLGFYEEMQMQLPTVPPLVLVEPSALESAEVKEGRHTALEKDKAASVFHTRGLTLSMEYTNMRTVVRNRGGSSWFNLQPEVVHIPSSHCEVTAILVLAGLPRLMAGSILAHECMHAWLRLTGTRQLPLEVEEGLCQLMALLWLERQPQAAKGEWEERFSSYCAHQIRTESSPVYGDGFRAALENFQKFGLPEVVRHAKATGRFAI